MTTQTKDSPYQVIFGDYSPSKGEEFLLGTVTSDPRKPWARIKFYKEVEYDGIQLNVKADWISMKLCRLHDFPAFPVQGLNWDGGASVFLVPKAHVAKAFNTLHGGSYERQNH